MSCSMLRCTVRTTTCSTWWKIWPFWRVLGILAWNARGAWREIYRNLFVASGLYALSSLALNMAIARGQYHTGSLYDIPFIASVCWMIWATLLARDLKPPSQPAPSELSRWQMLAPRLAMLAMLSLPVMGYWAWFRDTAPPHLRQFRLLVTLAAMLVLGLFVFLRQLSDGQGTGASAGRVALQPGKYEAAAD